MTDIDEIKKAQEDKVLGKTEDELFIEGIIEKPLSQWNKGEIKRFAELNDIDITGTKNAGEAKDLIKEFLDQPKA